MRIGRLRGTVSGTRGKALQGRRNNSNPKQESTLRAAAACGHDPLGVNWRSHIYFGARIRQRCLDPTWSRSRRGRVTTASFSREAEDYVGRIERKIVLIDGRRLADLMIDHGIGVAMARTYMVKKLDLDYFAEDEGYPT